MSILEELGFPSAETAKNRLFEEMQKVGASRLEASYSGGNDEGGVDDVTKLVDAEGKDVPIPGMWITRDPKPDDPTYRIREGKVHEYNPLWEAADRMLSVDFGTWAGEFSAYGTLFADVKEGKVWRDGEISSYDSDGHEY